MNRPPSRSPGDPADSTTEPIRARYDWASTSPLVAVIKTVSIALNDQPTALPPLNERIDSDTLDALITMEPSPPGDCALRIEFSYAGHEVTVVGHGEVVVNPRDEAESSMLLYIVDRNGNPGWIRDDLALRYDGPANTATSIERWIDEMEAKAETTDEVVELLIITLPSRCPVQEVGRANAPNAPDPPDVSL